VGVISGGVNLQGVISGIRVQVATVVLYVSLLNVGLHERVSCVAD